MPPKRRLAEYKAKRDFGATNEPAGADDGAGARSHGGATDTKLRFVIQQHSATRLHWDLRLEEEGVLRSWALPRGVPWTPKENHLAVNTEDHPIEYLTFHGEIPEGQYGAGQMTIWDRGWYEPVEMTDRKAVIVLHGERVTGRYALFQTRGRDWLIHRMDPPSDGHRRPPPPDWTPMRATESGELPSGAGWVVEPLWQGLRVLLTNEPGLVSVRDAGGVEVGAAVPEIRRIGRTLGATEVVLDGVLQASSQSGAAAARAVTRRLEASPSTIRRLSRDEPLTLVTFDLLWYEGQPLIGRPWSERRSRLDDLALADDAWRAPPASALDPTTADALVPAARAQGMPGLVAKRAGSTYAPGESTEDWRYLLL